MTSKPIPRQPAEIESVRAQRAQNISPDFNSPPNTRLEDRIIQPQLIRAFEPGDVDLDDLHQTARDRKAELVVGVEQYPTMRDGLQAQSRRLAFELRPICSVIKEHRLAEAELPEWRCPAHPVDALDCSAPKSVHGVDMTQLPTTED
jgi:hypothetical protein